jgi:hypothetical protein
MKKKVDVSELSCRVIVGKNGGARTNRMLDPHGDSMSPAQCERFPAETYIGTGNFASVFTHAADPTKVVKFTVDARDAQAARKLLGKRMKGAVEVFDVAQIRGAEGSLYSSVTGTTEKNLPVYGIVAERVDPLPDDWEDAAKMTERAAMKIAEQPGRGFKLPEGLEEQAKADCDYYINLHKPDREKLVKACQRRVGPMLKAVENIAKSGALLTDLRPGNWGLRDGEPVILDFGYGENEKDELAIDLAKAPTGRKTRRMASRRRKR